MHKPVYIKINENGDKYYYFDREMKILHRETGPAIEWHDGSKEWYLNGKSHREDGPAIEYASGYKAWYLNGKNVTQEEHARMRAYARITQKETVLTLDEIAKKFGVPVEKVRIKK
jgi:hypothetical protein